MPAGLSRVHLNIFSVMLLLSYASMCVILIMYINMILEEKHILGILLFPGGLQDNKDLRSLGG